MAGLADDWSIDHDTGYEVPLMARGKHGQSAQAKADATAQQQIRALQAELAAEREAHQLTRVELQNVRDRGAGDLLAAKKEAAAQAIANMQARLDTAVASLREVEKKNREVRRAQGKTVDKVVEHFIEAHGWTGADAIQKVADMLGVKGYIADDTARRAGLSPDRAFALDRARGIRTAAVTDAEHETVTSFNDEKRPW